jgi:opacity protein-like surface antigen
MLKRITFRHIAFLIAASTPAFSRIYLGGQVGGAMMRGEAHYIDQNVQQDSTSKARGTGLAYGFHLGYEHTLHNHLFFFLEGFYIKESIKALTSTLNFQSNPTVPGQLNVKPSSSYGASVGVGVELNPKFDLYAKLGFEKKNLKITYTLPLGQTTNGAKSSAWAIAPGAGFGFRITPSIILGPEYTYVMGKKYKVLPQTTNTDGTYSKSIYFTPTEHRFMLKLSVQLWLS